MSEISLILTSPAPGSSATAVALGDSGTGVGEILPSDIAALLAMRDQIFEMMSGATRMTSVELSKFSKEMGKILFCGDVGSTVSNAAKPPPLITKILATTKDLKAIPWEYAEWPTGQSSPQMKNSVVRLIPEFQADLSEPPDRGGAFRILLLSASPMNFDRIPWEDIRDGLIGVFQGLLPNLQVIADSEPQPGQSFIRIVSAATHTSVRKSIRDDDPHIVHFVGHGTDRGIALINPVNGKSALMDATAFGSALQSALSCRLAILSACDVANPKTLDPVDETIGTFAEQVARTHVPAVIASQAVINKETIATFCEALYRELLNSGSIDLAVAAGRCNVAAQLGRTDSAAIEWGIPVLYRRLGASKLFK